LFNSATKTKLLPALVISLFSTKKTFETKSILNSYSKGGKMLVAL